MRIYLLLRRILIFVATKKPYKVKSINTFIEGKKFVVDIPESATFISKKHVSDEQNIYKSPTVLDADLSIREIKRSPRYRLTGIFQNQDIFLYSLENAMVAGNKGLVYKNRSYIKENLRIWQKSRIEINSVFRFRMARVSYLKGVVLNIVTLGADGGFYHFLHELLPKLYLLKVEISHFDHFLINGPSTEWKIKWLNLTGIDLQKVIWTDHQTHIKCDQLIFPSPVINDQQPTKYSILALRKLINPMTNEVKTFQKEIIWISRDTEFMRNILWEKEILSYHPQIKFVDLKNYSIRDTVKLLSGASHIISPHGAGLGNIFMCKENTNILELYPETQTFQPCYSRISSLCSLNHFVLALDFSNSRSKNGINLLLSKLDLFLR